MMGRFAVGKDAFGISDRSGFRYRLRDMRKEWNGSLVGKDEYESKHPQIQPVRRAIDAEALSDPRPDTNNYTFTASSGTASVGNVRGGGTISTVGPVTLEN
jgi:hypothetical protein